MLIVLLYCIQSQVVSAQPPLQINALDSSAENERYWSSWLSRLYEMDLFMDKDSVKMNEEGRRIMLDSNYRKLIYPQTYTWQATTNLLKQMELKKGFWHLFNLYQIDSVNKKLVIETLVPFDQLMDMEKVMVSTFYSYALLDPKISTIRNGKPVITRPDIVEHEFAQLKQIIKYIDYYRKERKEKKSH